MLPIPVPFAPTAAAPPTPAAPVGSIALAVIIPAHRQPGLLAEAIVAVLDQRGGPPTAAVVVDDGCPFPDTAATALDLAAAHPGRVFVLRRRNGGLAAARNTGIDFALAAFPACRGLFFLDADNRLHPPFLARADAALRAASDRVGWFYPDFDEFGGTVNWTAAGDFALLPLLLQNYCDAGSLVRRSVFEAGLRFDETLRQGFEDWDFWLQASAAGFVGQHLPDAGFRYRRRPESMLAAAERQRDGLIANLHRKHAAMLRPQALLALEAAEAPRYAIHTPDRPGPRWLLDPAGEDGQDLPATTARERFLAAAAAPAACFHPPVMVFAAAPALALLRRHGLIRGLFWRAEVALREAAAVGLELVQGTDDELRVEVSTAGGLADAAVILVASRALASRLELGAAGVAGAARDVTGTARGVAGAAKGRIGTRPGKAIRKSADVVTKPGSPGMRWDEAGTMPGDAAEADWLQAASGQGRHPAVWRLRVTLPQAGGEAGGEGLADGWSTGPSPEAVPVPRAHDADPMSGTRPVLDASGAEPADPDDADPDDPDPNDANLNEAGPNDTGHDRTTPRQPAPGQDAARRDRTDVAAPLRLLLLEAAMLRAAGLRQSDRPAGWRRDFRQRRDDAASRAQALSGLGTVLPCPPLAGRRSFGFILPVFAFGGVERVVTAQAQCLRDRGWRTHLFILGAGRASLPATTRAAFESVTLAAGLGEAAAAEDSTYLGAEISAFSTPGPGTRHGVADALGLLAGMDAVLNTHSLGAHALMGRLRACGIRTYCGLHVVELGGFGNPLGTPHTALAYEHAYDGFTVISDLLRDWCVAQGLPAAKLHLVRNAPGYPADPARVAAQVATRRAVSPGGRLRALFLGRLDAQKGLDRLAATIARTRDRID